MSITTTTMTIDLRMTTRRCVIILVMFQTYKYHIGLD